MFILDTHALYWWVNRTPDKLGQQLIDAIRWAGCVIARPDSILLA